MAQHAFIVAYDIASPKRLRAVAKTMLGFGDRIQLSVFHCLLNDRHRELLVTEITGIIHHAEDRVVLIDLGPAEGLAQRRIQHIGRRLPPSSDDTLVI